MAWSYVVGQLADSKLMQVRWHVADTDTNDQLAQDEEINLALSTASDNVFRAASIVCNAIALKYGREMDAKGETQFLAKEKFEQYKQMAKEFEEKAKTVGGAAQIFAGGLSRSAKATQSADTDRVAPSFTTGLHLGSSSADALGTDNT